MYLDINVKLPDSFVPVASHRATQLNDDPDPDGTDSSVDWALFKL